MLSYQPMTTRMKDIKTVTDRIVLIVAACAVLGIVALGDWQLEKLQFTTVWRDYLLYNACLWFAVFIGMRTRLRSARFRTICLMVLTLHWILGAGLTALSTSFLWSGVLALVEIFALNLYWQRKLQKAD